MKKQITVSGQTYEIEKYGKNWYCRAGDTMIIKPTIREVKQDIETVDVRLKTQKIRHL